jgi:hypothetical protein
MRFFRCGWRESFCMRVLPMPLDQRPIHRIGKQRLDVEESLIDDRRNCMDGNRSS